MPNSQKIAIIGVGLLGGSLALALKKKKGLVVVGWNHRASSRRKAARILKVEPTFEKAIRGADVVILCSHSSSVLPFLLHLNHMVKPNTLILDVSSIKGKIVEIADQIKGLEKHFVPCHPMAGKEKSGADFADAKLYQSRYIFITPLKKNPNALVRRAIRFWVALGAKPVLMDAKTHDQNVALTSHLPHLLASAFVQLYDKQEKRSKNIRMAVGSGFKDFTRIAGSNPSMWSDILEMNSTEVLAFLTAYRKQLSGLEKHLKRRHKSFWMKFFEKGRSLREKLS
jgi:prephenate dehydrogenase